MQALFLSARRFTLGQLARLAFLPPLLARIVVGVVFVQSGWGKLHNLDKVIAFFTDLGIPAPQLQAPFVAGTELVCGALLLAGLATRFAAIPLFFTMLVALATAQWENIASLNDLFGTVECLYGVMLIALMIGGAGRVSLDARIARRLDAAQPTPARTSASSSAPLASGFGR
jgi:putative oxidoreductase